jgi:UDP-2,4-diacetamido-2,4,6-trideoxy-beta-L-altropyranose hydrolase
MRCLAQAQGWQELGGSARFAMAEMTPAIERRLEREGMEIVRLGHRPGSAEDAAQTVEIAGKSGAAWVIADGYAFGADWQQRVKASGARLLLWDDYGHAGHYYSDLVLNQNLSAEPTLYARREPYTRLLLGPQYAQLRREFLEWRGWQREIPAVARKLLVTLGGSDPNNVTGKIIEGLQHLVDLEATVVVGGSNPNLERLRSAIGNWRSVIKIVVDVPNMPALMAWADVAVTGGGSTCWETSFLGLPTCVMVVADNQTASAQRLHEAGAIVSLGRAAETGSEDLSRRISALVRDKQVRRKLSERGHSLVDGLGGKRVLASLRGES